MIPVLPWAIAVIETTPERWMRLARSVPDELMRRPAARGEWSALACLHHLTASEEVQCRRSGR